MKTQRIVDWLQFLKRIPDCTCLMFGPWVLNETWITNLSSALIGMLMSSSKLFLFSKEVHFISGVRLLMELYCAVVIKHIAFFTILAKLTVVLTCTSLPLNLYTSIFRCGCGFGFEQKFRRIDRFGGKKVLIGGFAYLIHRPPTVKFACLDDIFSEFFQLEASPVAGQSLQQKDNKRRKRKGAKKY